MHVRRALALTAIAPLFLAGCSNGDPEADPTPRMPESTSSSPTPTESETPEAESPEDFIRRWVAAGDEMQVTGDTAEYRSLIADTCKACEGFASSVESVYKSGGSAEFAGTAVSDINQSAARPPTYEVSARVPDTVIHHADTGKDERLPGGTTKMQVILRRDAESWLVTYFGILR